MKPCVGLDIGAWIGGSGGGGGGGDEPPSSGCFIVTTRLDLSTGAAPRYTRYVSSPGL